MKRKDYIVRADFYPNGNIIIPLGITDETGNTKYIDRSEQIFTDLHGVYKFNCLIGTENVRLEFDKGSWYVDDGDDSFYAIAYLDENGFGFSDTEPFVQLPYDSYTDALAAEDGIRHLGCKNVTIFKTNTPECSVTWEYVYKHRVNLL